MSKRRRERDLRPGLIRWILLVGVLLGTGLAAPGLLAPEPLSAQTSNVLVRDGTIGGISDVDWFPLFALVGESFVLTLERETLRAGRLEVWKPAVGDAGAQRVARSAGDDSPLIWTAPEGGAWRVRVAGLGAATGTYRLRVTRHLDAIGAQLSTAQATSFNSDGILIERSRLDSAGDVDWFAVPVSAQNRYRIWSVAGSVRSLAASVRAPSAGSFQEVDAIGNAFGGFLEPEQDGIAILSVRATEVWMIGSYAVGVTRLGTAAEPEVSLPPRETSLLQIASIEASSTVGQATFDFRGAWGPIRTNSGLRVWVDTDPSTDEEDEWEYLLRSNDGRHVRIWSFAERKWIETDDVGASGFDTLLLRWSGRTADAQIRWQASVRNSDGTWTVSRPGFLAVPHPRPALPPLWFARERIGSEDPRWQEELEAAGVVVPDLNDEAVVVALDAGHGVDNGAWDNGVREADSNLDFALRIEELLEQKGVTVVQTRRTAGRPYLNLDEAIWRPDLQARPHLAHLAKADVFVSIHSNANYLFDITGLEAWYLPRWNGDGENLRLAETLLSYVQEALTRYGYPPSALTYDTSCWEIINNLCDPIYVLAPFLLVDADSARRFGVDPEELGLSEDPWGVALNEWLWRSDITVGEPPIDLIDPETQSGPGKIVRANLMPTALLELLYVTDEREAQLLRDPEARQLVAQAIADAILDFLDIE
ncbi:MAG: N-acetylmuramoyl-L-alanine amidase [Chloroflexi bacterium]|nr:N-acetylmuramoyl-L-alanine amidase [Chloroflexota bacterium]